MKTLIFPSEFIDNRGGVPQSTISIVKGLSHFSEFKIIVVCPNGSEMSTTDFPLNVIVKTTKKSVWTMSKNKVCETLYTILDLYRTIRPFLDRDTWVITNQPVTSALLSLIPSKHINEIYINRGGNFQDKGIASKIIIQKLKHHCIDFAVGISKKQTDLLIQCGMPENRVTLIHNGLPMPAFDYPHKDLSKDYLRISTMGFISDLKNQIEGIRLIKLLRDHGINAILNLYGDPDGDNEYQTKIAHEIKILGIKPYINLVVNFIFVFIILKPYINFCGFVSGENLFAETDILISFSRTEGFGRSLVEGMLRRKPIIAWRGAGGPIDITDNGKYGHLVESNNADAYFKVVCSLLDNPSFNKNNVEAAYNFAYTHFTTECMVKNYAKLIKSACNI